MSDAVDIYARDQIAAVIARVAAFSRAISYKIGVLSEGVLLEPRGRLDFYGPGVTVEDDPTGGSTKVTIPGQSDPASVAPDPDTLVLRGGAGDVYGTTFRGAKVENADGDLALDADAGAAVILSAADAPLLEVDDTEANWFPSTHNWVNPQLPRRFTVEDMDDDLESKDWQYVGQVPFAANPSGGFKLELPSCAAGTNGFAIEYGGQRRFVVDHTGCYIPGPLFQIQTGPGVALLTGTNPAASDYTLTGTGHVRLVGEQLTLDAGSGEWTARVDSADALIMTGTTAAFDPDILVTADGTWKTVYRTSDHAGVTSSAVLVDDGVLEVAIAANVVMAVEVFVAISASAAGGHRETITAPAGATGTIIGFGTAGGYKALGGEFGGGGSTEYGVHLSVVIVNGATAGTVKLRYAQLVSDGTATVIKAGSHLKWRRLS